MPRKPRLEIPDGYYHVVSRGNNRQPIFDEVLRTGKVLQSLPEDEKAVRALHAEEVLKIPLGDLDAVKPGLVGCGHGQGAKPRLLAVDPGYRPNNLLIARMTISDAHMSENQQQANYYYSILNYNIYKVVISC